MIPGFRLKTPHAAGGDAGDDPPLDRFVRQFARRPVRDGTLRRLGRLASERHNLADLLRTEALRGRPWRPRARLIRRELWAHEGFALSARDPDIIKRPRRFVEHLTETLCYAA
jgi:hypothetical protein